MWNIVLSLIGVVSMAVVAIVTANPLSPTSGMIIKRPYHSRSHKKETMAGGWLGSHWSVESNGIKKITIIVIKKKTLLVHFHALEKMGYEL